MKNSLLSSFQKPLATSQSPLTFSIITVHHGIADENDPLFHSITSAADQEKTKQEQLVLHTTGITGLWNKASRNAGLSKKTGSYTLRILEEKPADFYNLTNRALPRARGTFVGFLQPGEHYLPDALASIEQAFQAHPDCDVLISSYLISNEKEPQVAVPFSLEYLSTAQPHIPLATIFFRASLINAGFLFDPCYDALAPTEWLLRIIKEGKRVHYLPQTTSVISQKENKPASAESQQKLLQKASTITRLLRSWWKIRHHLQKRK